MKLVSLHLPWHVQLGALLGDGVLHGLQLLHQLVTPRGGRLLGDGPRHGCWLGGGGGGSGGGRGSGGGAGAHSRHLAGTGRRDVLILWYGEVVTTGGNTEMW